MEDAGPEMERRFPTEGQADNWRAEINAAIATAVAEGKTWVADGPMTRSITVRCPVCTHMMLANVYRVIGLLRESRPTPTEIICDCSEGHTEAGDDTDKKVPGCGFGRGILVALKHSPSWD